MNCAIVIPTHKDRFDRDERMSIERARELYRDRSDVSFYFLLPERAKEVFDEYPDIERVFMPDEHFISKPAYSAMMKSSSIYGYFLDHDYMLIHQTDAFILKDELDYWMNLGYDYYGAAWVNIYNYKENIGKDYRYCVGNGGFSLRRVKVFHDMTKEIGGSKTRTEPNSEDRYLCWARGEEFTRPQIFRALQFSFETRPQRAYELNGYNLPFGCHAWSRVDGAGYKRRDFYRPIFKSIGYEI